MGMILYEGLAGGSSIRLEVREESLRRAMGGELQRGST